MTPLRYLKDELSFTTKEWLSLSREDKDDLLRWAAEEMQT